MSAPTRALRGGMLRLHASVLVSGSTGRTAARGSSTTPPKTAPVAHIVRLSVAPARPTPGRPGWLHVACVTPARGGGWGSGPAGAGAARLMSVSSMAGKVGAATATNPGAIDGVVSALQDPTPAGWWPSQIMEAVLVGVHDWSGLPWGLTIIAATATLRLVLLPLILFQMRNVSRLAYIKDEMEEITKRFQALGGIRGPPQAYDQMQKQLNAMYAKHDCYPTRSLVTMVVQAPIMISMFLALRRMATEYPSMVTGGELWFVDLSVTDPTYALPVCAAVLTFCTIEFGTETGQAMSQQQGGMKTFLRVFSVAVVPLTIVAGIPNSVLLYWVTTNTLSLTTALILKLPGLKPALGILPPPPPKKGSPEEVKKAAVTAPVIPGTVFASKQQAKAASSSDASSSPAAAATATPSPPPPKGKRVKRRGYHVLASQLGEIREL